MNLIYTRPLIPLLLSYISGLTIGLYLPGVGSAGYLLAAFFFGHLYCLWKKRPLRLLPLLLFTGLGYLAIQPWVEPSFPSNHVSNYIDTEPWHIKGTIIEIPRISDERTGLVVEAKILSRAEQRYHVCGRLRLTVRGIVSDLYRGDTVAFFGRLKAPRNFNNPNGFNYKRYLAFRGIWVTSYLDDPTFVVRIRGEGPPIVLQMLQSTRKGGTELIAAATRDKNTRVLLRALLLGDRNGISPDLSEVFNRTGLGHLIAISGLHIGMVAAFFFSLFRILLSRSERLLLAGTVSKWGAGLTILPVLFYGLLVGMSPSTQRAVIMVLVFLIAIVLEKEHHPINTLAVAAFIILIVAPVSLFDISFQFSFIAVFSILYGLQCLPWKGAPSDSRPFLFLKKLGTFVAVSFFAIMGTLPLVLYYFNQTSLIGLLSNCIAVPIVGFLVLPIAMLAMLVLPVSSYLAVWIMKCSGTLVSLLLGTVSFLADWSFAAIKTVTPTLFEIVLFYALTVTLLNLKRKHLRTIAIPVLLVIISVDVLYWMSERFWHRDLRVTVLDVGQGNAALLELPKGPCILIDGGGFFDNSFDMGRFVVAPFLWQKKIATIDYIVLSHPQADHLNGLLYISRNFNVREFWCNGEPGYTETYRTLLDILSEENIPMLRLNRDSKARVINGVRLNVLHPSADIPEHGDPTPRSSPNNHSLVVKAVFDETAFLFPGDIEATAERELLARAGAELKSGILLAPHHGSRTSSTPVFLDRVQPNIVIFSARSSSRFRHPHPEVLKRYRTRNCEIFRTDYDGAIMLVSDGKEVTIKKCLPGNKIKPAELDP